MEKKIINKCDVKDSKTLEELSFFSTDVKRRTGYDIGRLKKSIVDNGFLFPIFIWEQGNIILDGKSRYLALKELVSEGFEIETIPVVIVSAKDEVEAKEKMLQVNSRYGKITEGSLNFFAKDCNINLSDLNIHLDKINFEFQKKEDAVKETERMIFSTPSQHIEHNTSTGTPLSFGGNYEPLDTGTGFNDSSIEQTWVNEHHEDSLDIPNFAEESENGYESSNEDYTQNEPQEPYIEKNPNVEQFDNALQNEQVLPEETEKHLSGVSFMCPFCYSNFTLSLEKVKEILGE